MRSEPGLRCGRKVQIQRSATDQYHAQGAERFGVPPGLLRPQAQQRRNKRYVRAPVRVHQWYAGARRGVGGEDDGAVRHERAEDPR